MVQCPYCKSQNVTQAKHDTSHTYKCFNCGSIFIYTKQNQYIQNIEKVDKGKNKSKTLTFIFCSMFIILIYLTTCLSFFKGLYYRHSDTNYTYYASITNIEVLKNDWFTNQPKFYVNMDIEFQDTDNNICTYTFENVELKGGEQMAIELQETNQVKIYFNGKNIELADNLSFKNNILYFILATVSSICLLLIPLKSRK